MRNISWAVVLLLAGRAAGQDMPLSQILLPDEGWKPVPLTVSSVGGMAGDGRGNVFVSVPDRKELVRLGADGKTLVMKTSDAAYGLAAGGGHVYACLPAAKKLVRLGADGKETVVGEGHPFQHVAVTKAGVCYATVPAEKAIYRIADGKATLAAEQTCAPGGLAPWADDGTLVVSDATAAKLWTYRIDKDGKLVDRDAYYQPLRVRPKQPSEAAGMTLDDKGRVYAASHEGVQAFDPTGRLSGVLTRPERDAVTAVAFGGKDLDHLYIACGGRLFVRKTQAQGISRPN